MVSTIAKSMTSSGASSAPPAPKPASKFGEFLNGLPPMVKGIMALAGTGVVLFASYKVYKHFSDASEQKDEKKASDSADSEYKKLLKQGKVLSKSESAYRSTANLIEKLLDGCESSSSEFQVIENVIKVVKKPVDWAYLQSVFGVRKLSDCGSFGMSKTEYDLSTLLKDQLDTSGVYSIDIDNYKDSGFTSDSIEVLRKYFSRIGISI